MPERIQRQRTKGWRMPDNARYVGRPSSWGNPFVPGECYRFVDVHGSTLIGVVPINRDAQAALFRRYVMARLDLHAEIRDELAGKDLACWCPLVDDAGNRVPCHADVLLEIANGDRP